MGRGSSASKAETMNQARFMAKQLGVNEPRDLRGFTKTSAFRMMSDGLTGSSREKLEQMARKAGYKTKADQKLNPAMRSASGQGSAYQALGISDRTLARINKMSDKDRNAFIKQRYKNLSKVYHPDSFNNLPAKRQKAIEAKGMNASNREKMFGRINVAMKSTML